MSKRLIMICAIAFVLGLAVSAHAAVQNVKVSGDLKVSAIGRDSFDLGAESAEDNSNVIMSQTRVRLDTDLTENVAATVRLLSETDWGRENQDANNTDIDIDLANVTMKEMFDSPVSLTLGRQELMWGAGFVLGDPDSNRTVDSATTWSANAGPIANRDLSLRKAFDAVKVNLDYNPLMIEAFYSKIDENAQTGKQLEDKDDIDLYGAKASYALGDKWGTLLEAYLLYRNDKTTNAAASDNSKADTIWCPGLRTAMAPIKNMIVSAEIAWQTGAKAAVLGVNTDPQRQRQAMAAQATASYALPFEKTKKYSPVVGAAYSYYSGDKNPGDVTDGRGEYKAWDPMYENQGTGKITNVLFDATNVHVLGLNATFVPMADLKIMAEYSDLWLAQPFDTGDLGTSAFTLYGLDGNSRNPVTDEEHLGRELDLTATYDYTEDVQLGLTYGAFLPGNAFQHEVNDEIATQLIGTCSVSF